MGSSGHTKLVKKKGLGRWVAVNKGSLNPQGGHERKTCRKAEERGARKETSPLGKQQERRNDSGGTMESLKGPRGSNKTGRENTLLKSSGSPGVKEQAEAQKLQTPDTLKKEQAEEGHGTTGGR